MNTAKRTLLTAAILVAAIAAFAQAPVTFKGSVLPLGPDHGPILVHLSVDGQPQEVRVKANGHFRFTVQQGQQVRMVSSCEGFVEKEVVIDAAHFSKGRPDLRTVEFDVELEQQNVLGDLYHPEPVGNIAFAKGTGRLLVARGDSATKQEQKLTAARR